MEITCRLNLRNLIVEIQGDIDHHTVSEIREKIDKEFTRAAAKNIIFNFKNVSFMDSSGIGMIIGRYRSLESQNGSLVIAEINREISRIFEISGLQKILKTYDSVADAEAALN